MGNHSHAETLKRIQSALDAAREVFTRFTPGAIKAEYKAGHVAGARNSFGARLAAARPNSRNTQRRVGGGVRIRVYEGVELAVDGIRLLEQWDGRDGLVHRGTYRRMIEHAGLKVESSPSQTG